jgi:glycosyltransferase involved in cell wall biosynthesis
MSRRLKILHIGNGKAFKIKAILDFLKDRGHEIHFIPIPSSEQRWDGISYYTLPPIGRFSKIQVLKNIFSVRRLVKEINPDIVHAHNAMGPGWYGAFSNHHPYVVHAYGSDVLPYVFKKKDLLSRLLTLYSCKKLDRLVVTGKHMTDNISHLKIPLEKIKVIPRGVNLEIFRDGLDTNKFRQELNIDSSSPVILSPRYQLDKDLYNFDTVIESIPHVKKIFPEVVFLQLYDPAKNREKAAFEKMAAELGVSENYIMIESVENRKMPYVYNLSDIVVSIPSSDGFPVTVLEASACFVPIVVTKLDFTSEWFVNDDNGILIPERDPLALSDAVIKILKNKSLQERIARKNKKQVEEKADYEQCMMKMESLYYEVLRNNH